MIKSRCDTGKKLSCQKISRFMVIRSGNKSLRITCDEWNAMKAAPASLLRLVERDGVEFKHTSQS